MFNGGLNSFYPYQSIGAKRGLFSLFKGKINWGSLLNNTQKTLNIINQAIPVFYQVKPVFNNTKTIFKIMGAIKEDDKKIETSYIPKKNLNNSNHNKSNNRNNTIRNDNNPNFFL